MFGEKVIIIIIFAAVRIFRRFRLIVTRTMKKHRPYCRPNFTQVYFNVEIHKFAEDCSLKPKLNNTFDAACFKYFYFNSNESIDRPILNIRSMSFIKTRSLIFF